MVTATQTGLIHIAGVIDREEAELLISCGAKHLGFPLVLGHHKEDLTHDAAAAIVAEFGDQAEFFLITYLTRAEDIIDLCETLQVRGVQLHNEIATSEVARLRQLSPALHIIKSIIISPDAQTQHGEEIDQYSPNVDAFITDTHDPVTGATGATGKTHDWEISRHIVQISPRPVILAGGLNPGNVKAAIAQVRPAGVDVHTGIEGPDGRKDCSKTQRFIEQAREGYAELP
ncbi:MAG: phosphoribosylanthranilate isomerase [Pseudomonadota bacterium]